MGTSPAPGRSGRKILLVTTDQQRYDTLGCNGGTIDAIDLGDDTTLVVYSTDADPRTMALTIGGGTAGALDELKRQMETTS